MTAIARKSQQKPPEDLLAVVRALAKRYAREDHAAEITRLKAADRPARVITSRP